MQSLPSCNFTDEGGCREESGRSCPICELLYPSYVLLNRPSIQDQGQPPGPGALLSQTTQSFSLLPSGFVSLCTFLFLTHTPTHPRQGGSPDKKILSFLNARECRSAWFLLFSWFLRHFCLLPGNPETFATGLVVRCILEYSRSSLTFVVLMPAAATRERSQIEGGSVKQRWLVFDRTKGTLV